MDEQQIKAVFEELQRQLETSAAEQRILGQTSKGTADAIDKLQKQLQNAGKSAVDVAKQLDAAADAQREAKDASKAYKQSLSTGAKGVAQSATSLMGSLASGSSSFAQFGQITQQVTNLMGKLASAFPVLGKYVDAGIQAAGAAGAAVINQLDTVAKAYTDLGKVGAIGAQGVDGLVTQFKELGLVSLPAFTDAVVKNAQGLAALGPTTSQGSRMLGRSLGQLTDRNGEYAEQIIKLGYSLDEAAAISTQFAATQALAGNRQIKTSQELAKASMAYLKEIDGLARATGRSREQIIEERQKNLQNIAFRAKIEEMRASGNEKQIKAAAELEKAVDSFGGPVADLIRASVTGTPLTKEAQTATALLGNSVLDLVNNIQQGSSAEVERYKFLKQSTTSLQGFNQNLQYGLSEALGFDPIAFQLLNMEKTLREGRDPFKQAFDEQGDLAKAGGKTTKEFAQATIAVAGANRNIQALAFDAIPAATTAVQAFANTINAGTNALRKVLGISGPRAGPGAAPSAAPPGGSRMGGAAARKRGGAGAGPTLGLEGLRIKSPEAYAGGETAPSIISLAHKIQQALGGDLMHFSAFNDTYERGPNSKHSSGLAMDFTVRDPRYSAGVADLVRNIMSQNKINGKVIDEYLNPSKSATGGHIHVELDGYRTGGIASGPKSGYNAVLHGTEAVVPLPDGKTIPVEMSGMQGNLDRQLGIMGQQLSKMDELISAMREQTSISQRILQVSQA